MESEARESKSIDDILFSLQEKAETLKTYLDILAGYTSREEASLELGDILDCWNRVKQDHSLIRTHINKMKQTNEEIKKAMDRLGKANDYLDYIENNIPEGFCPPENGAGDAVLVAPPSVVKEPFVLFTVQHITEEEFKAVPYYLRGRLPISEVNEFIDTFNQTLKKKYQIVNMSRNKLKVADRQLRNIFKTQELPDSPGLVFCTEEDMKRFCHVKNMGHWKTIIPIVRHMQRIKEVRADGIIRFAAVQV